MSADDDSGTRRRLVFASVFLVVFFGLPALVLPVLGGVFSANLGQVELILTVVLAAAAAFFAARWAARGVR
ncbi:hypothetical protein CSPHI_01055 [Corynebacterium sphenisci DSM 44792]|uniref:Transporter n=1 Tax=Corynebacterium sphenisci DSM 44792 TaxID=1437874 RepID=A0A1L7CVS1_9CORY|nr:hypothetical protein [Corynebacterium sphenisci]APT89907.1 hypothetical protein CSPHI_01055 [Corynebacterium sphenisci DSM 44792]